MGAITPRPDDFIAYWDAVDAELGQMPAAPEINLLPLRTSEVSTVYAARFTSIGPYRLFGFLSVPTGPGPFPGLLVTPRYGSVNNPPHRDDKERYVVLVMMHRGQRLADQPYAAAYPGLLTDGITDPATYVYRGIVADCLRGLELLRDRPEVEAGRIGVIGDDLALITAARRPGVAALQVTETMFYRLMEARLRTGAYPVEEVNDYLRAYPGQEEAVARTLAYVEPFHHASSLAPGTATQFAIARDGEEWLRPMLEEITGPVHRYPVTAKGGIDHDALDAWMAEQLGVEAKPRLWSVA